MRPGDQPGTAAGGAIVVVAHTDGEEGGEIVIRIISARKATATGRIAYAEAH